MTCSSFFAADNNQTICSDIETSLQSPICGQRLPFALLMGLPVSITKEVLAVTSTATT